MRRIVVAYASVIALGAIAAGLARVGATIAQLRALDVTSLPSALTSDDATVAQPGHDEAALPLAVPASAPASVDASKRPAASAEEPARETPGGDAQIMRWLAEDAVLARTADVLLRDPDPAVQAEVRAFLRELGVDVGESRER